MLMCNAPMCLCLQAFFTIGCLTCCMCCAVIGADKRTPDCHDVKAMAVLLTFAPLRMFDCATDWAMWKINLHSARFEIL